MYPKLRFKGFDDAWEQRKFGNDIISIHTGTNLLGRSDNKGMPLIKMGNLKNGEFDLSKLEYLEDDCIPNDEDFVKKGDFLFNTRNTLELVGKGATWFGESDKYAFNSNIARFVLKNINTFFYNYLYNTAHVQKQIRARATGTTSVAAIYPKSLDSIKYFVPSLDEQSKLARYFQILDNLITLHQRQCEALKKQKQFFLQNMFPKEGESVPRIRFNGFTEPWEQRKLKEITSRVQGNDGRVNLQTLTISAGNGWMKQEDRFSANIAGKEQKNYTLLKKGELAYNHGNSKLAKFGAVFELKDFDEALVPRVYHSFRVNNKTNSSFIEYMFATKLPDKELGKLVSSGARMDGLLNIGYEDFVGINITVPSLEEQQKIAYHFRKLDEVITLHQRQYEQLVSLKKYLLSKMFI